MKEKDENNNKKNVVTEDSYFDKTGNKIHAFDIVKFYNNKSRKNNYNCANVILRNIGNIRYFILKVYSKSKNNEFKLIKEYKLSELADKETRIISNVEGFKIKNKDKAKLLNRVAKIIKSIMDKLW